MWPLAQQHPLPSQGTYVLMRQNHNLACYITLVHSSLQPAAIYYSSPTLIQLQWNVADCGNFLKKCNLVSHVLLLIRQSSFGTITNQSTYNV